MVEELCALHASAPLSIPSIKACCSFEGDSFLAVLLDICVSHNEDPAHLLDRNARDSSRFRFQNEYPVGCCVADTQMVAAALRLADVLDFDRERTPATLFHYLLSGPLDPEEDRTTLEWGKHMSISNWEITDSSVLYRGRCTHHVIHHAIVEFTRTIKDEICSTRETFVARNRPWPFALPGNVTADIQAEGYRYLPYRFELDDSRVYDLLMGGAIYDQPVVAVRELLQNAIDACRLRDSLATARAPYLAFSKAGRIRVRYEEPNATSAFPRLTIEDTGVGMDSLIIENYFLRVGRSYYNSAEFQEERLMLREKNLDFAPVSEFGIGFLSVFLLGDNVIVDTAASEPRRGDHKRHSLHVHGPSRLIRVDETPNEGPTRFSGTSVCITLTRGGDAGQPLSWKEVEHYVADLCQDLPYSLTLQHLDAAGMHESELEPRGSVHLPAELSLSAIRIPVSSANLEGEIILVNPDAGHQFESQISHTIRINPEAVARSEVGYSPSILLRGGFAIGSVPGLPHTFLTSFCALARLNLKWDGTANRKYLSTTVQRTSVKDRAPLANEVVSIWLTYLLDHRADLPAGQIHHLSIGTDLRTLPCLNNYSGLALYELAKVGWRDIVEGDKANADKIGEWECANRDSLYRGPFEDNLYSKLLDLILPDVCSLQMGYEARFSISAPKMADWRDVLASRKDYASNPRDWGGFAEYLGQISDLLYFEYTRSTYLNSTFREKFEGLSVQQVSAIASILERLARNRAFGRPTHLAISDAELFEECIRRAGDLAVGSIHGRWRIDSFSMP